MKGFFIFKNFPVPDILLMLLLQMMYFEPEVLLGGQIERKEEPKAQSEDCWYGMGIFQKLMLCADFLNVKDLFLFYFPVYFLQAQISQNFICFGEMFTAEKTPVG